MDQTPNLQLPLLANKQGLRTTFHDDALKDLDTLVMLSVIDRDLSSPPGSPAEGDRYIVKTPGSGDLAWLDDHVVACIDGGWRGFEPKLGWTCYVQDESTLLAWDGSSWQPALDVLGVGAELQNVSKLGVGTTADATNPLSAKLNNALFAAKTVAEGGDGSLRYKLSKEGAADTLSFLYQDNFSGRAEIGLTGDDDFHFKVSPDGTNWLDAIVLDKTTAAVKIGTEFVLAGEISPAQITANQNDYNPANLSAASVLRLSTDASRELTGLGGGAGGRVLAVLNVGANPLVLKDASASSGAANRFSFGADVTLAAGQAAVMWYDATDSRWKLLAGPTASGGGGSGAVRYDTAQSLTSSQQFQARKNAGLAHGADVASAATLDLDSATGDLVDVTGTTAVTAITLSDGSLRTVRFTGALTLTHGSSLVLPGAQNIATAAGDFAVFRGYASGVVRCTAYLRAAGRPLNSGVADTLTAGFTATSYGAGTKSSGTFTPDPTLGNLQHYTNGGAHTLAPPSSPCTMIIECTNSSAGAITTSGFSIVDGDTYSSAGTKKHIFYITKTNSSSRLTVIYVTGT